MNELSHASLSDLPGHMTPQTVRQIAEIEGSWGRLSLSVVPAHSGVVYDEAGRLWVDGTKRPIPGFVISEPVNSTHVIVLHHEGGIAIHMDKRAYVNLPPISASDFAEAQEQGAPHYLPVNRVLSFKELPSTVFAKSAPHRVTLEGEEALDER